MFANSFVSLLVGGYVCYWVCLLVGLWPGHNIIFLPLGMVSVLDCFITELWQIIGHIGSLFIYFFLCGLLLLYVLPWVICFMFGVVWVLGFFFFFFVL